MPGVPLDQQYRTEDMIDGLLQEVTLRTEADVRMGLSKQCPEVHLDLYTELFWRHINDGDKFSVMSREKGIHRAQVRRIIIRCVDMLYPRRGEI
jgi:hypothetical protein